jgi:hypothetical protein
MLGPSIVFASAPPAVAESLRALRAPGQRLLGALALLVAFPAMAWLMLFVGGLCYLML